MNTDINMEDVRKALQLTERDMREVHLIPHYRPGMAVERPIIAYSLKFDRDAEFTVTHLAALAVVFDTHSIRVSYVVSDYDDYDDYEPSECNVEVGPDA
jgi:hypothetical protein